MQLLKEIAQLHHELRPDLFIGDSSKFNQESLDQLIRDKRNPVFVYVDENDEILGHLFLEIKCPNNSVRVPVKSLYIEDLCVKSDAKNKGVGKTLMSFAKDFAKEHDCYNITLNAWFANQNAFDFYRHLGFAPQQVQMEYVIASSKDKEEIDS